MKKQISHILFFLFTATLVAAAGVLAFNGLHQNSENKTAMREINLSLDDRNVAHVLDTVQFFEEPCYTYCQLELVDKDQNETVDILSKTIVKVANEKGDFENIDERSIKEFPANKSLNLMVEKYTLKRKMVNSSPSFFVTVESFHTRIYQSEILGIDFQSNTSTHTSFTQEDYDWMKIFCLEHKTISLPHADSHRL